MLDLTARNRLINFRHTKGASLRIIDELPDQLATMRGFTGYAERINHASEAPRISRCRDNSNIV